MMSQISTIVIYSYEFYIITGRNRCNGVVVTHLDHGRNFGCESRHIPRMKWSASGLFICDSFVFVGQQFDIAIHIQQIGIVIVVVAVYSLRVIRHVYIRFQPQKPKP